MNNRIVLLFLTCCLFTPIAKADGGIRERLFHAPLNKPKYPLLLIEVDRQQEVIATRKKLQPVTNQAPVLPNRVYLFKHEERGRWYLILTDGYSKYPMHPLEFLRVGTVLPGSYLGARNNAQRYLMNQQGLWVPTFRKEQHYFWQDYEKGRIKAIEFFEVLNTQAPGDGRTK